MENSKTVLVSIFGEEPEERKICTKCDIIIYTGPDATGRLYDWCNCTGQDSR